MPTTYVEVNLKNSFDRTINNPFGNFVLGQMSANVNYQATYNEYTNVGTRGWRLLNDSTSAIIGDDAESAGITKPDELLFAEIKNDFYPSVFLKTFDGTPYIINPTKIIIEARKISGEDIIVTAGPYSSLTGSYSKTLTNSAPYVKESFNYSYSTMPSLNNLKIAFLKAISSSTPTFVAFDITVVFAYATDPYVNPKLSQNTFIMKDLVIKNQKTDNLRLYISSVGGTGTGYSTQIPYSQSTIYQLPLGYTDFNLKLYDITVPSAPVLLAEKLLSEISPPAV